MNTLADFFGDQAIPMLHLHPLPATSRLLTLADTGVGIPGNQLPHVFDCSAT